MIAGIDGRLVVVTRAPRIGDPDDPGGVLAPLIRGLRARGAETAGLHPDVIILLDPAESARL